MLSALKQAFRSLTSWAICARSSPAAMLFLGSLALDKPCGQRLVGLDPPASVVGHRAPYTPSSLGPRTMTPAGETTKPVWRPSALAAAALAAIQRADMQMSRGMGSLDWPWIIRGIRAPQANVTSARPLIRRRASVASASQHRLSICATRLLDVFWNSAVAPEQALRTRGLTRRLSTTRLLRRES